MEKRRIPIQHINKEPVQIPVKKADTLITERDWEQIYIMLRSSYKREE